MDNNYYKQYEPIFGVWHITRLIGEGSFGKVFEIEREDFGQVYKAALKVITIPASQSEVRSVRSEGMDEESVRATFESKVQELVKEFVLMSKLKGNSNVVSYENHQVIEHKDNIGWDILIQMELLTPLDEYIQKKKALPRQEIIKLGIDLCKALELCQKHNIIHRDIKPENTFISENGDFKLGDFGVARTIEKTTGGLSKQGSYPYMAPEIYNGKPYGTTVDIYSLGLILYRLLNGNRLPFLPPAPSSITYADRENAWDKRFHGAPLPMPSHADGRLGEIVLKACAFEPKERYSSPGQMRQELEAILYSKEEGKYIYPDGDDIRQDSIHSVKSGDEPPVWQEEGGTVSDFGGTVSDFGKTVSDFSGTVNDSGSNQGVERKRMPSDIGSSTDPVQEKAARKKGSGKPGVIAACLAVAFIVGIGLLSKDGGEGTNPKPAQGSDQSNTTQEANYLETITDENGQIIREPIFRDDGTLYSVREYENSEIVKESYYDENGDLDYYCIYEYDGAGNRVQESSYSEDGTLSVVREYENSEMVKASFYDENGVLDHYYIYEYDSAGNQVKRMEYSGDSTLSMVWEYENSEIVKTSYYNGNDGSSLVSEYENSEEVKSSYYDENGTLSMVSEYENSEKVKESHYDENGALDYYYIYEYDSAGNQVKGMEYSGDGILKEYEVYEYNEQGKNVKHYHYNGQDELQFYTIYTYDEDGNYDYSTTYKPDGSPL